jgi:hypothetical protein
MLKQVWDSYRDEFSNDFIYPNLLQLFLNMQKRSKCCFSIIEYKGEALNYLYHWMNFIVTRTNAILTVSY